MKSLLSQKEAAVLLGVSASYLRASDCPKVLLPGRGKRPVVRYNPDAVQEWAEHWTAKATHPQRRKAS